MKFKLTCKAIIGYDCKFELERDNAFDVQNDLRAHIQFTHEEQNAKRDMEEVVGFDAKMQELVNEQE